jgi:RHS repeat-associated protein
VFYNVVRRHESVNKLTPAIAAGVPTADRRWTDIVRWSMRPKANRRSVVSHKPRQAAQIQTESLPRIAPAWVKLAQHSMMEGFAMAEQESQLFPVLDPAIVAPRIGSGYPEPLRGRCTEREKRVLGDPLGLTHFGVNLVRLPPGAASALRHWHSLEDEFVMVLELQAGAWVGNDLEYNQGGRLAAAVNEAAFGKSTQSTSYAYDAFGQRLLKQEPQGLRFYQYDPAGHLLEEGSLANGSATPERDYIYLGDRPVALLLPGTGAFFFLQGDRLDTPQLATDAAERAEWTANYQPFGAIRPVILNLAQNLRFPGQYADPETGYHHNGFRDYAVDLGRYLQSDPIGLLGGLNTYVYAMGNPINARDPSGLLKIPGTDIDIPIDIDIGHDGVKAKPQDPLSTINKEYVDPAAAATLRAQIEAERQTYKALLDQLNARRFDRCTPAWIKNTLANSLNSIAQQYDNDVQRYNNWQNHSTNIPPIENQYLPYPSYPVPGLPTPNANYR